MIHLICIKINQQLKYKIMSIKWHPTNNSCRECMDCDWYYLTYWQTLKYLATGKLPHKK